MNLFPMALRNLIRHRQRTLVTTAAMAFAGYMMIVFASLMYGLVMVSERNAVIMDSGDLQIHAPGFRSDPDLYKQIPNPDALLTQLKNLGFRAAPRLYGFALAAAGASSAGVQLRGIRVAAELHVTELQKHLASGLWLNDANPAGVVVGRRLARTLNLKIGDEVVVVGQASDGSVANELFKVRGILKSVGDEIDRGGFFMTEQSFRDLMALPKGSHEIALMRRSSTDDLETVTQQVAQLVPHYETRNWKQLKPVLARILSSMDSQIIFMLLLTYIAVGMVVLNAMLMSVFERMREFGVMKAIGVTPRQLLLLVYCETLIQTTVAMVLAAVAGIPTVRWYERHGIDLTAISSGASFGGIALDPVWYAHLTEKSLFLPLIVLFVVALVAVLYPALKAALITPVAAIHGK